MKVYMHNNFGSLSLSQEIITHNDYICDSCVSHVFFTHVSHAWHETPLSHVCHTHVNHMCHACAHLSVRPSASFKSCQRFFTSTCFLSKKTFDIWHVDRYNLIIMCWIPLFVTIDLELWPLGKILCSMWLFLMYMKQIMPRL